MSWGSPTNSEGIALILSLDLVLVAYFWLTSVYISNVYYFSNFELLFDASSCIALFIKYFDILGFFF